MGLVKKKKIIIYGIGKFAEYIAYSFTHDSKYEVIGHCIESSYSDYDDNQDLPLLNFDDLQKKFSPDSYFLFIAVGNDIIRERIFNSAKKKHYQMASYISSSSIHWENLKIGENVFISEDSAIQPFVNIEDNCILIGSKIGHHSVIKKNTLISTSTIGANVVIGENSFLGINSCIKSNVIIGSKNIIGMGAIINSNTKNNEIYSTPTAKKRSLTYANIHNQHLK